MGKALDITGMRSGSLVAVRFSGKKSPAGIRLWLCKCDCGGEKLATASHIKQGLIGSCGCTAAIRAEEMVGKVFNRWTVLRHTGRNKAGDNLYECQCECGTRRIVKGGLLRASHRGSKSCGCLRDDKTRARCGTQSPTYKHGMAGTLLGGVWAGMLERCYKNYNKNYHNYGGRGITICDEWREKPELFFEWCFANGWEQGLEIDRIDNDGPYSPGNCRFVTHKVNAQNRRPFTAERCKNISKGLLAYHAANRC